MHAQLLEGMRPDNGYGGFAATTRQVAASARPAVQKTVTIRNEVNLKKPSLSLVADPSDASKLLVQFTFDASADCLVNCLVDSTMVPGGRSLLHVVLLTLGRGLRQSLSSHPQIGVYYAAVETKGADGSISGYAPLNPGTTPPKEPRRKGLGQTYRVPLSHPLETGSYPAEMLQYTPPRESGASPAASAARRGSRLSGANAAPAERYPVVICLEAVKTQARASSSYGLGRACAG